MGKKIILGSIVLALSLSSCGTPLGQPATEASQPWVDGGAGISYRVNGDNAAQLDIRANRDCERVYTENFFYGPEGTILRVKHGYVKDEAGEYRTMSSGEVATADVGKVDHGAVRSELGSVRCAR